MRPLEEIRKDLAKAIADDSFYSAETLEEFDELQKQYYERISKLIVERNMAEAEAEGKRQGISVRIADVEETVQMLLASE